MRVRISKKINYNTSNLIGTVEGESTTIVVDPMLNNKEGEVHVCHVNGDEQAPRVTISLGDGAVRVIQPDCDRYLDKGAYLHRTNGPAAITDTRIMYLWRGHLHRADGPALIEFTGRVAFHFYGHRIPNAKVLKTAKKLSDPTKYNGYILIAYYHKGQWLYCAGCRKFTFEQAIEHWRKTRRAFATAIRKHNAKVTANG